MKKRKAYIIDRYSTGSYHEVINQGYLMMIASLYNDVTYIGEISACANLRKISAECGNELPNVKYIEKKSLTHLNTKYGSLNYFFKIICISLANVIHYIKTPKNVDVFFNNNLFFASIFINVFALFKKNRVFTLCHNEMEWIDFNQAKTVPNKILWLYFLFFFKVAKISPYITFILLSPKMVDYFSIHVSKKNRNRIHSIDHCYIRPEGFFSVAKLPDNVIKVGIPGAITLTRGLPFFEKIVESSADLSLFIYSISYVTKKIVARNYVSLNQTGRLLDFLEYSCLVKAMDWLLFLYPKDSYRLTASGAVLEAIWNQKPIIALRNHYFDYLFSKFGNLGILCDSEDELYHSLKKISEGHYRKEEYIKNLETAKKELKPDCVSKQLEKIIRAKGC